MMLDEDPTWEEPELPMDDPEVPAEDAVLPEVESPEYPGDDGPQDEES